MSEQARAHHSPSNRFAMLEMTVARHRLQRMPKRMTEIQNLAKSRLLLILPHDVSLDLDGSSDHMLERARLSLEERIHVRLQKSKQLGIGNGSVLDHFRQSAAKLAIRQRFQYFGIRQHHPRWIEGADQVLSFH